MGDLNVEGHKGFLKEFYYFYNLKNLIKVPTCFKNPDFPTSIDVILTTSCRSFHNPRAIETGLSDFNNMIMIVMKSYFQKKEPKISTEEYRQYILSLLSSRELTRSGFDTFMTKRKDAFDIRVPIKHKHLRSNRIRLRNLFLRTRCKEIKKLIINSGAIAYLLYGKLSNSTITTLIIGRLLITNHFGNILNLFFPIKDNKITVVEKDLILEKDDELRKLLMIFSPALFQI